MTYILNLAEENTYGANRYVFLVLQVSILIKENNMRPRNIPLHYIVRICALYFSLNCRKMLTSEQLLSNDFRFMTQVI